MDININLACGSGGCVAVPNITINVDVHVPIAVIGDISALPGGRVDDGVNPPTDDWATYNDYLVDKCAFANQLATDITTTWERLGNLGLTLSTMSFSEIWILVNSGAVASVFAGLIGTSIATGGTMPLIVGAIVAVGALGGSYIYGYFDTLQEEISVGDLVCAIYGTHNLEEARTALNDAFDAWGINAGLNLLPAGSGFMAKVLELLASTVTDDLLEALFEPTTDYIQALPPADCAACALPSPLPSGTIDEGLLSYYRLEEESGTRVDAHGTIDLTPHNGPGALAMVVGMGADFERSVPDALQSAVDAQWTWNDEDWTIAFWIRTESIVQAAEVQRIFVHINDEGGNGNGGISVRMWYTAGGDTVRCYMGNQDTGWTDAVMVESNVTINPGAAYFVCVWHDSVGDTLNMQVNAATPTSQATSGKYPHDTLDTRRLTMGANYPYWSLAYDGGIDEAGFWLRALSADERTWLFNGGSGRAYSEF